MFDFEPASLNLLARGYVREALAEFLADLRQAQKLRGRADVVRNAHAHPEVARRAPPVKMPSQFRRSRSASGMPCQPSCAKRGRSCSTSSPCFARLYSSILLIGHCTYLRNPRQYQCSGRLAASLKPLRVQMSRPSGDYDGAFPPLQAIVFILAIMPRYHPETAESCFQV